MVGRKRRNNRFKKALTGIETAIILISFVIVAAAFAFAVLNIGFQTTQKAQSVIRGSMEEAASALELDGAVIGVESSTTQNQLKEIRFTVRLAPGRNSIDFNLGKIIIAFTAGGKYFENIYVDTDPNTAGIQGPVRINPIIDSGEPMFLEFGDKFEIVIDLEDPSWTNLGGQLTLGGNDSFKVELKPQAGSVLTIERVLPPTLSPVMFLG